MAIVASASCMEHLTTYLQKTGLILVLANWAVSTGATEEHDVAQRGEKRGFKKPGDPYARSSKQAFAPSEAALAGYAKIPKLWEQWVN